MNVLGFHVDDKRYREIALRMSKAFKELGYFLFERNDLEMVSKILKGAKLGETLRIVHLGDVKFELSNVNLDTGYYAVSIDHEDCIKSCETGECIEKCVEEKKESVSQAVLESIGRIEGEREDDLSRVYKKLVNSRGSTDGAGGGI